MAGNTYHVEVGPDLEQSTHHIALTDGKQWLGLIVCDSKGAADPFNISASPNQRSSLRTKSGTTKYEDLEEPWSATAQDDWSGGRALEDYEDDTTRFYDSRRCQTAYKQIYNAPLDYYATGIKAALTNYPGSVSWKSLSANVAYAYQFTLDAAMEVGQVYVLLRRRGNPGAGLRVSLCQNTNGAPGTELAAHLYKLSEITDVLSEWKRFTFDGQTLAKGSYWIKVQSNAGDIADCWQIGFKENSNSMRTYVTENGKWVPTRTYDMYYRVAAPDDLAKARFFTYRQLTFALVQTKYGSPRLYMNGEIGMADSNASDQQKVVDATKNWKPNQWAGCRVGIIAGQGIQESESIWRTIMSNDATTLTLDQHYLNAHNTTTTYIIVDTEQFTEIPAATHGLTKYVTDIAVANGIIYFAQGDKTPIRKLKWENGSWYGMTETYTHYELPAKDPSVVPTEETKQKLQWKKWLKEALEKKQITQMQYDFFVNQYKLDEDEEDDREPVAVTVNNCATFLQTVRDSTGLILWRAQNDDDHHQISISRTAVTDWLSQAVTLCDLQGDEVSEDQQEHTGTQALDWLDAALEAGQITQDMYDAYKAIITGGEEDPDPETEYEAIVDSETEELYSDGVAFAKPDDTAVMYKVTIGKIKGDNHPVFKITLQGSEDNIVYQDIQSIEVDASNSIYYFACKTNAKWRRIHVTISAGESPQLFAVKVETVNYQRFIDPHSFHDSYGKITGLAEYPMMMQTTMRTLWIMREGMIHSISSEGAVDTINLEELSMAMDEKNGVCPMEHSNYLYIKWMKAGIQRYYNQTLDACGPDRDAGLPDDRAGNVVYMLPYPGRFFAVVNPGRKGYSCVLLYNNSGWHEIYRAPNMGEQIYSLGYQAISGERPDRLWMSVGNDIMWLVMPSNTLKAIYDKNAEYTHESVLVSSWMSIGMVDVIKQWGSMNVMAEGLTDGVYIEADYQVDQDPNWYPMSDYYTETPTQEIRFDEAFGVSAKRLRYRLRLQTNDKSRTPIVKAVVMKTVFKVSTKYNYTMPVRNVSEDVNLRGELETLQPYERHRLLTEWADNAVALRMYAYTPMFNDKRVFLDPISYSNLREKKQPGYVVTINLNEI